MILLDTHALIWYAEGHPRLGPRSRELARTALEADQLWVSAFSFWEVAILIEKRKIRMEATAEALRFHAFAKGIQEIAISGEIGIVAAQLQDLHADPADRFIVATALSRDATLVTADAALLRWQGKLKAHNARV